MQHRDSTEPQKRVEEMLFKLKSRDFRITPQRLAVLKILAGSDRHPSVDDIYQEVKAEFPTTSLATVYKTVSLLKELNEVLPEELAGRLRRADLAPVSINDSDNLFRVWLGPYGSHAEAESVILKAIELGFERPHRVRR